MLVCAYVFRKLCYRLGEPFCVTGCAEFILGKRLRHWKGQINLDTNYYTGTDYIYVSM